MKLCLKWADRYCDCKRTYFDDDDDDNNDDIQKKGIFLENINYKMFFKKINIEYPNNLVKFECIKTCFFFVWEKLDRIKFEK